MVDACGWEIIRNDPFGNSFAPHRRKLNSVFGYSSTCVPSILSGRWPDEHRNWCYFVYDPKNSPFRSLRPLRFLPQAITSRRIFRRLLTRLVKVQLKFRGYFDLYNIPFKYISLFDFTEKKSPLQPKGMNRGPNIFDFLTENKISYFVSNPLIPEEQNRDDLITQIEAEDIEKMDVLVLEDGHCFRDHVLKLCKTTRVSKSFDLKSGSFETLIHLANEGMGMTLLPYLQTRNLSNENFKNLRHFTSPEPAREISIVFSKSQLRLPIIEALSQSIEGIIRGAIQFENIQLISPK